MVSMPELSWHGRTLEEVRRLGLACLLSAMYALDRRGRSG